MGITFAEPSIIAELDDKFNRRSQGGYHYEVILKDDKLIWKDKSTLPPTT